MSDAAASTPGKDPDMSMQEVKETLVTSLVKLDALSSSNMIETENCVNLVERMKKSGRLHMSQSI